MGKDSKIEWCDHTFNPWVGCQKVSAGCTNCYAERDMTPKPRWANAWGPPAHSERLKTKTWNAPVKWNKQAEEKRPRVFCGSLCDIFEDNIQVADWGWELWDLIEATPNLDWLLLTKRPENVMKFAPELWKHGHWPDHVYIGTSIENQETADERIPYLAQVPARRRFLSLEPLLGHINLGFMGTGPKTWRVNGGYRPVWSFIHWIIVGGESGPNARPMHPEWVRTIRDQCQEADMPFFFKQWGEYSSSGERVGRKKAGKLLDGEIWNEFPD